MNNFKILLIKNFHDKKIALYSYDLSRYHYLEYKTVREKENYHIEFLGGAGGMITSCCNEPLAILSGIWEEKQENKKYFIAYGEIFDNRIQKIEINYPDGSETLIDAENNGFLTINENCYRKINFLKALDHEGKELYCVHPEQ